jgi:hypothetical protein
MISGRRGSPSLQRRPAGTAAASGTRISRPRAGSAAGTAAQAAADRSWTATHSPAPSMLDAFGALPSPDGNGTS